MFIKLIRLLILIAALPGGSSNLEAQGICIPKPLTVYAVKGRILFEAAGKAEPLGDATVEISAYGYQKPVLAKMTTPADGRFDLSMVAPGRYYLSTEHPAIIGMRVEIWLQPSKKAIQTVQDIEFVLRNDPGRSCGGGTVSLVPRSLG